MALFLTLSVSLNAGKVCRRTNIFSNSTIKTDFAQLYEHWLIWNAVYYFCINYTWNCFRKCSDIATNLFKAVMEPQNNVQNLFKVHERDTKTTSLNAQKRSEDVLNVFWTSYIRPVASFLSLGRFHTFWCFHFWFWTTQTHSITQYCGTAPTLWFTSIYLGTIFHF